MRVAAPAKFKIVAHTDSGDQQMVFRFLDVNRNAVLDSMAEYFDVITYLPSAPTTPQVTWRFRLASGTTDGRPRVPPGAGDRFEVGLTEPFGASDVFLCTVHGERVDHALALEQDAEPYVVPNPYVASAAFEPERFAVGGRGEVAVGVEEEQVPFRALAEGRVGVEADRPGLIDVQERRLA